MAHTITRESTTTAGTVFERSDGETFILQMPGPDGSAQFIRTTPAEEHWGVHLDASVSVKVPRARQLVLAYPDLPPDGPLIT